MMYVFASLQAYSVVRAANMTVAQAYKAGHIYLAPRAQVVVKTVDGVNIYCYNAPF